MDVARAVAKKSPNPSTKVGCVFVSESNNIISTGYNDFPPNMDLKCMTTERPMYYMLDVHAEMRALATAGCSVAGARAYITYASCENCLKHLLTAGIKEIIYDNLFTTNRSTGTNERLEAAVRLVKGSGIPCKNMQGITFLDDLKNNGVIIEI